MKCNPYEKCPVYETDNYTLRMVEKGDAKALLKCYSDKKVVKIANADNCTGDFYFQTIEEMNNYMDCWLYEYSKQYYVRFAIVDKRIGEAIGTIEICNKGSFEHLKNVGVLRLDICSSYEREEVLNEILEVISLHFYHDFGLENIMTKAIPEATARTKALKDNGYYTVTHNIVLPYDNYFIRNIITPNDIANNVGYCGLICTFCHEANTCGGCKCKENKCENSMSDNGCYQYNCCKQKGINGCWECDEACCGKGMFSEHHDLRNRVFVKCAKQEGIRQLCEYVLKNQLNGIFYGWNRDYDNLGSEQTVIELLHNGVNSKNKSKR